MSFWDRLRGKKTTEYVFTEKSWFETLGIDSDDPQQQRVAGKNLVKNLSTPGLSEEQAIQTAALETVRDVTRPGTVTKGQIMQGIADIMNGRGSWEQKFDALDLLEVRAINGLDNVHDENAMRREIGAMQERLLRQGGRL